MIEKTKAKPILVYYSDWFIDSDLTVVKHLTRAFTVHWFVIQPYNAFFTSDYIRKYCEGTGVNLHIYEIKNRRRSLKWFKLYYSTLRKVRKLNPAIIYTACSAPYFLLAFYLTCRNIKVVKAVHDAEEHSNVNYNPFLILGSRIGKKIFNHYFLFSKNQLEIFHKNHPDKDARMVGMSTKNYGPSKKLAGNFDEKKILFFGSLAYYKGYDLMIKAFERIIRDGNKNLTLSIFGEAHEEVKKNCYELIKHKDRYNLNLSFIDNEDVADIFSSHHFVIFPYRDATQSGPQMIAIYYGKPIIASNINCFQEMRQDGSDAILYDNTDPDGLYHALKRVANMTEAEYQQMLDKCLVLKDKYSEENIANNFIREFNDIIASEK